MRFGILGPVEAFAEGGRPLISGTGKPVALLALLLLHPGEMVPAARLIDDLWGDDAPRTAAKSLQTYVSQLRRALGDDAIQTRPGGYLLALGAQALDAADFEREAAAGVAALEAGDAAAAAVSLRGALALWRGAALGALAQERWARPHAERLEEARLQALQARIEADLALGRHRDVVSELEQLRAQHPYRERFLALLMLALYRCGRQADALEACRVARKQMAEELGIEPAPELAAMELRILRHDPSLAGPVRQRGGQARPSARLRAWVAGAITLAVAIGTVLALAAGGGAGQRLAGANALVLVGPDGLSGTQVPVGAAPAHAARGGGFLWASNELDGTVSRVAAGGGTVETIPVGPSPQGMAYAYGDMWVAIAGTGTLAGIDPRAGKVVRVVGVGNGPVGVAARGAEIWVANSVDGTLSTVDPGSGRAVRTVPVGPDPTAVVATASAVWVALAGAGAVVELDAAGRQVIGIVGVGNDPSALAAAGGSIWVANTQDSTVSRIDAATGAVAATIGVPGAPTSLAAGSGSVWVTLANGRLARIDARSARVVWQSAVGAYPASVVAVGTDAWMTTFPAPQAHRGGTLRVQTDSLSGCQCVDPAVAFEAAEWQLLDLAYNGLVAYRRVGGPAGGTLVGDLAQAVPRPTGNGRTYVFQLRRGVRFSTGRIVTARDVAASFERLLRINHVNLLPIYGLIAGASTCGPRGPCDLASGIVADDRAGTVTFHLTAPDADFPYALALPFAAVVPAGSPLAVARQPLPGTGPYQIAAFVPGRRLVLTRNPRFRVFSPQGTPDGYPDRIVATLGAPPPAQLAAVERGSADVATDWPLPPSALSTLATRYAARFHADSLGGTEYFLLNTTVAPFTSLDARRAVNEAVDRQRLVQLAGGPFAAQPTCQVLPPDFPGYRPYCPYGLRPSPSGAWTGPDRAQALRLVAASGTRGDRVTVWAPGFQAAAARYVAGVLSQLGYHATVRLAGNAYLAEIASPRTRAQIGWGGWIRDYTSAADFISPLFTCAAAAQPPSQATNYSRFCSPALERQVRVAEGLQQLDPVAAQQAWAVADRIIVDSAAAIPYANPLAATLLSRRTGNYQFNPEWGVLLDQLWVR
jgi:YVTN family beta-propeller protein